MPFKTWLLTTQWLHEVGGKSRPITIGPPCVKNGALTLERNHLLNIKHLHQTNTFWFKRTFNVLAFTRTYKTSRALVSRKMRTELVALYAFKSTDTIIVVILGKL